MECFAFESSYIGVTWFACGQKLIIKFSNNLYTDQPKMPKTFKYLLIYCILDSKSDLLFLAPEQD